MNATTTTTASAATVAANNTNPRTGEPVVTAPKPAPKAATKTTKTTRSTTPKVGTTIGGVTVTAAPAPKVATKKVAHFDHANCGHATQGAAGKKARAACRRLHASAAKNGIELKATPAKATKPAPAAKK